MAGSYAHICSSKEWDCTFRMDLIENMSDAAEALEESFYIIKRLESTLHVIANNRHYHENSEQNCQTAAQFALEFLEERRGK